MKYAAAGLMALLAIALASPALIGWRVEQWGGKQVSMLAAQLGGRVIDRQFDRGWRHSNSQYRIALHDVDCRQACGELRVTLQVSHGPFWGQSKAVELAAVQGVLRWTDGPAVDLSEPLPVVRFDARVALDERIALEVTQADSAHRYLANGEDILLVQSGMSGHFDWNPEAATWQGRLRLPDVHAQRQGLTLYSIREWQAELALDTTTAAASVAQRIGQFDVALRLNGQETAPTTLQLQDVSMASDTSGKSDERESQSAAFVAQQANLGKESLGRAVGTGEVDALPTDKSLPGLPMMLSGLRLNFSESPVRLTAAAGHRNDWRARLNADLDSGMPNVKLRQRLADVLRPVAPSGTGEAELVDRATQLMTRYVGRTKRLGDGYRIGVQISAGQVRLNDVAVGIDEIFGLELN